MRRLSMILIVMAANVCLDTGRPRIASAQGGGGFVVAKTFRGVGGDFGFAVAGAGARILVGAPSEGAAYLFDTESGTLLRQLRSISPAPGLFGSAVALSTTLAVVGAPRENSDAGAVYVFDARDGTFLASAPGTAQGDQLGFSVAIDDTTVLAGVPFSDAGAEDGGEAVLLDGATGTRLRAFHKPIPAASDFFGTAVAFVGHDALVGAPFDSGPAQNAGAAYLFAANTGALRESFRKPNPAAGDLLGSAVAARGNSILLGAPGDHTMGSDAGAAYLFDGTSGAFPVALFATPASLNDGFGYALAVGDTQLVVGVPLADAGAPDAGAAFVFEAPQGTSVATLTGRRPARDLRFGRAVAFLDPDILIGSLEDDGTVFLLAPCGDGILDPGQECDDGNDVNGDSCDVNCTLPACGNGIADFPEDCDGDDLQGRTCVSEGFLSGEIKCTSQCTLDTSNCFAACGDGGASMTAGPLAADPQCDCSIPDPTCDDGIACTDNDVCLAGGICAGTPNDALCDDGRDETIDYCLPNETGRDERGCSHEANCCGPPPTCSVDGDCDDNDACTLEACKSCDGCTVHAWPCCDTATFCVRVAADCDDSNTCTEDSCSASSGCLHYAVVECTPCSDDAGCDDGNDCTTDRCNPLTGCIHTFAPSCQPCATDAECNDANPCTSDACSLGRCLSVSRDDGVPCSNLDRCDGEETCQRGECTAGLAPACFDGVTCSCERGLDSCAPRAVVRGFAEACKLVRHGRDAASRGKIRGAKHRVAAALVALHHASVVVRARAQAKRMPLAPGCIDALEGRIDLATARARDLRVAFASCAAAVSAPAAR
jgi:cysteine-rich repeat protein